MQNFRKSKKKYFHLILYRMLYFNLNHTYKLRTGISPVLFRLVVNLHDLLTAIYNYMIVNSLCKSSFIRIIQFYKLEFISWLVFGTKSIFHISYTLIIFCLAFASTRQSLYSWGQTYVGSSYIHNTLFPP